MSEDRPDEVRHSRRFISRHPERPDIHGVQFPSGRVIADDPRTGLVGAVGAEYLDGPEGEATIIWSDEPDPTGVGESKSPD
ncbi:hypothetical protein ACFXPN_20100 [Streptomyces griseorubiginosus]|uniref:hypothetical protein n=1 Tax=Streptomyces griseorubiginosus TaxID=67304 RepID=UPI003694F13C